MNFGWARKVHYFRNSEPIQDRLHKSPEPTKSPIPDSSRNIYTKLKGWISKLGSLLTTPTYNSNESRSNLKHSSGNQLKNEHPSSISHLKTKPMRNTSANGNLRFLTPPATKQKSPIYIALKPMRAPIGTMTGKINGLASNTPIMLKTPQQIWDSMISSDESTLISNDFDSSKKTQFLTASETLILPEIVKPKETLAEVKKGTKIKKETKPKKQKTLEEGVYSAVLSEGLENRLDMTEASDVILTNMFRCFQSPKNEASEE